VEKSSESRATGIEVSLLKSTKHRQQLGQAGLNYVKRVHSHEKIAHQLEARLEAAIKEKHG